MPFARRPIPMALFAVGLAAAATPGQAVPIVGLTTTHALVSFDSAQPAQGSTPVMVTGMVAADERLLAIDLRPSDGRLYGVSSGSRLYRIDGNNGQATLVAAIAEPLQGTVSIDFNPVADLASISQPATASLRVVTSSGQNLAVNATTGATTIATDISPGFGAVAYANNDLDPATGTRLFYVDANRDMLTVANTAFNAPTILDVGALGVDVNGVSGLDIAGADTAFAAFTNADTGKSGLFRLDLGTGAATFVGAFGLGGSAVIAPPLLGLTVSAVPEPETWAMLALGLAAMGVAARRRRGATAAR